MTRKIVVLVFVLNSYFGFSQSNETMNEVSIENSVLGIQIGLIGIWAHNEFKLSNQVALRSEIGLSGVNTGVIEPLIAIEPRWYYNLDRRVKNERRIDGNSGNYFSLRTSYHFNDDDTAKKEDLYQLLVVPTYGIRRNIGNHFNYEIGGGIGVGYRTGNYTTEPYINLRFGYRF